MTQAERITALEIEVSYLRNEMKDANDKLDSLIALKLKGAGAFWLASAIIGTGIVGLISQLLHYIGVR